MLNRFLTTAANSLFANALVSLLERVDSRSNRLLHVVTYHRVTDLKRDPYLYPKITVSPVVFEHQMRFIHEHYRPVSMQDVLQAADGRGPLPEKAVLITFDDAYCDFTENAFPILQRYHLPVTLFVPTAFPDHPERAFWWDKLYTAVIRTQHSEVVQTPLGPMPLQSSAQRKRAFSLLRNYVKSVPHAEAMAWVDAFCRMVGAPTIAGSVLSWADLRGLSSAGVTLGAHTRTHPMLSQIPLAEARVEASGSFQDLTRQIGDIFPIFAYPSGGYTGEVVEILKEEGFQLAFTTIRGVNDLQRFDRLQLRRINVGSRTSLALLRYQLLGNAGVFNR